jgi:hypothetical protein
MNWIGVLAVFLAFPVFALGCWSAKRGISASISLLGWGIGVILAVPALLYFAYYAGLFGEPIWFYKLRAVAGTELLASLAGFLAGWFQVRVIPRLRLSRWGTRLLMPVLLGFGVAVPYLKPLLRPQQIHFLREQWKDGVCLQSTASTCGPASAATVSHHLGFQVSERELALAAYTSASGTENWYLARALDRLGLEASFAFSKTLEAPLPAIVGVSLKENGNSGHFIALLEKQGDKYVFGDPMEGRFTNTLAGLADKYEFTGFMLSVQPEPQSTNAR